MVLLQERETELSSLFSDGGVHDHKTEGVLLLNSKVQFDLVKDPSLDIIET